MNKKSFEELLQSIDRPGDFFTHGRLLVPMPVLEVDGVGSLSFPVPDVQVRALIEVAQRAPYGKGTETLVDTSVRDCWQIDAERVRLGGRAWPETFSGILGAAADGLGCPVERLDAQLYKLLVYPSGGFFSSHRDTPKADGMIATLTLSLPTAGAGAELIVRHRGREATLDMNADEPSELAFAAFYADCSHESRPVRRGHRLSLVFNLCLRPGDAETPRLAPDYSDRVESIANFLIDWRDGKHSPDKYVWLMEHNYSESGLSFDALKRADAAVARVLTAAADLAECELHLAIVNIREEGIPVLDGFYVYGEDWDEVDADRMEMDELLNRSRSLDGWMDRDGGRPPFGETPLLGTELLPAGALDDAEPDDQRVHEATGNEGMTIEQFYRRAAFVIWPRSNTLDVIRKGGIEPAVSWVSERFDGAGGTAGERIGDLVDRLIEIWPSEPYVSDKKARAKMLRLLAAFGDENLTIRFLREVVLRKSGGSENEDLAAALEQVSRQVGLTSSAAYTPLWRNAAAFLLARSATVPEEPRDWRIASEFDCDCQHCAKLRAFCRNPAARAERFPLRKDLRKHLHRIIDAHRLDMSHVTERRGSPFTLVCTKNRASYRRRLTEYEKDVSGMRSLIRSAPAGAWGDVCATELERLREAVANSG